MNQKACLVAVIMCVGVVLSGTAQDTDSQKPKKKGSLYFLWGYNRDSYTKSDIHFKSTADNNPQGPYDFTFYNAMAKDKPSVAGWWKPNRLTIPQYDIHLGYMLNDKHDLGIEIGWEHLKYVVTDNQTMHMKGTIGGKYYDKDTLVTPGFIHVQHTNGNNYALVNLVKKKHLWATKHIEVSAIGKVGVGPLMSVTITNTFGQYYRTGFRYQGWVFPASAGLRVNIYKYFFIQGDVQGAYVDYLHSRIGGEGQGTLSQHFYSLQWLWAGGINVPL
jgi:hypothetical protein